MALQITYGTVLPEMGLGLAGLVVHTPGQSIRRLERFLPFFAMCKLLHTDWGLQLRRSCKDQPLSPAFPPSFHHPQQGFMYQLLNWHFCAMA
jgi:hypothetical protein